MSPNTFYTAQLQHPVNPWDRRSCFYGMVWMAGLLNILMLVLHGVALFVPCTATTDKQDTFTQALHHICGLTVRFAPLALAISMAGLFLTVLASALMHAQLPISVGGGMFSGFLALVTGLLVSAVFVVMALVVIAFYLIVTAPEIAAGIVVIILLNIFQFLRNH
jgi:hypothetical protein